MSVGSSYPYAARLSSRFAPSAATWPAPFAENTACQERLSARSAVDRLDHGALGVERLAAQGGPDPSEVVRGQLAAPFVIATEDPERRLAEAAPDAELDPPAGQDVDDSDVLGEADRVLDGRQGDGGADANRRGAGGDVGQEDPR